MKKLLLLSSLFAFVSINAQNIVFTDANFKNVLLNSYNGSNNTFIDTNNDNEISQSEAFLVSKIDTYYTQINSIDGIEYFINLKSFNSLFYNSSKFNYPTLVNLEEVLFANAITGNTNITDIDFSFNVKLKRITIEYLNIVPNLVNLINLRSLYIWGTFNQIDLSGCPNINEFSINAPLTQLNLSSNLKLINFNLSGASLQNLDLSNNLLLETFDASNNNIETINFGDIKNVTSIGLNNNLLQAVNTDKMFNLQTLNLKDNNLTSLSIKNDNLIFTYGYTIDISGNPNLQTICCDANEIDYLQNICNLNDYTATISECLPIPPPARPLTMFPNPVKDILHLDCSDKINKVEVFGSNGLLIMTSEAVSDIIDMQSFANGMYFLKVYRDNSVDDMKFIKG